MTAKYRATVNLTAPLSITDKARLREWSVQAGSEMARKIDAHMILGGWSITRVAPGVYTFTARYVANHDAEAVSIIHDAASVSAAAYDAVKVTKGGIGPNLATV